MRIGIDLDDTVFEFARTLLNEYELAFGKKIEFETVFSYKFWEVFQLTKEEMIDFFQRVVTKSFNENLALCEQSKESIHLLAKNNKLYFITSRIAREGTIESLRKHFPDIDFEIVFSGNAHLQTTEKTKADICKELNIDVMIEDDKEYAKECSEKGIKVLLLDKPWNRGCKNNENIIRIKNWGEIVDKLEELNYAH
jgi:uncharacterized HAD superfamily protein